jgi:hypothetical protein
MRPYTFKQIQTFIEVARQQVGVQSGRAAVCDPACGVHANPQLEDAFGLALIEPVGRNIRPDARGRGVFDLCHCRHGPVQRTWKP